MSQREERLRLEQPEGDAEEHRALRKAVACAAQDDDVTWVADGTGEPVAAVVPAQLAEYAIRHGYYAW